MTTFQKIFKNGGHFEFFAKMQKHKIFAISLTVRDRAILSKFSTPRVSKEYIIKNFSKMAAILNFRILHRNAEPQNYSDFIEIFPYQEWQSFEFFV